MSEQRIGYLARLGAAMAASNYPVTMVRQMIGRSSSVYGLQTDFIALPNHVQVVGPAAASGSVVKAAHIGGDLRFDQTFPLARLISETLHGRGDPVEGEARLERIRALPNPYPSWVTVLGYGVWSAGLALVLEPTTLNVLAATVLGFMVGLFWVAGQRIAGLAYLVPAISAFAVTGICIVGARYLELDHVGLRALIPPLAMFLPGAAITLAVIELTSRDVISGSSRLIAGFVQIVQLAFGIVIAAQVFGLDESQLSPEAINKIGAWAPWLGVAVYAVGVMLFMAPPRSFMPWLIVICYIAFAAQFVGDLVLGSYASGFCGGLALSVAALALSRRDGSPPAITMILPGFWLLVPGSMGLIGVTEIFGADGDDALPATLISMISVAFGLQAGLVLWQAVRRQPAR
ncbi:threonine/serine exporter family protein [[Mycobacterium] wendilense]|uniref:Threonine/serine exporter family protein n=1 Tax=[Mycobacterium] wendilense TaxID=3064284 RepID=A0ABM9MDB7_9MYCO|nr:threonine/serine exporter family protein [Mycolicibacterium sp. MU0050]CAJ1582377.1 threonine/serine exporter family protein [Mycolicibacterium sp. MU0050]